MNERSMTPEDSIEQASAFSAEQNNAEHQDAVEQSREALEESLAQTIRDAAKNKTYVKLTALHMAMNQEKTTVLELLDAMMARPEYEDIRVYKGSKDRYYYTYPTLANNYVKNCALAEEDDLEGTIADIVRYESQRFPRATIVTAFTRFPYAYTKEQVVAALGAMQQKQDYDDIQTYTSQKGNLYIFSTRSLTPQYAKTLVEIGEDITLWM